MKTQWTREEMLARLCAMAGEQVGVDASAVRPESDFFADLNFDSLDAVEYVMKVEDEFDASVSDEMSEKVRTPLQALEMLEGISRV